MDPIFDYLTQLWWFAAGACALSGLACVLAGMALGRLRQIDAKLDWLVAVTPRPPVQRVPYPPQWPVGPQNAPPSH